MERQKHKVTNTGRHAIRVYFYPGTSSQLVAPGHFCIGNVHRVDYTDADPVRYTVEPAE